MLMSILGFSLGRAALQGFKFGCQADSIDILNRMLRFNPKEQQGYHEMKCLEVEGMIRYNPQVDRDVKRFQGKAVVV